jgi:UDP-N-acetylglucosamine--N-acetylmuramyl-(pentapeptide) pyrophosphoryl-undecaprenol N-acetylglucosamine transferase
MSELRVIISGGGTGGHIFPAIAIANALKSLRKDVEILFVGALGKMEMEKVPAAGYKIIGLDITGIQRSISLSNLKFPFRLFKSLRKSKQILKDFKPNVVVGVGGFASGPIVHAANRAGIPTLVQEQNSYAGITNKYLGKKAETICVAYEGMERFFPQDKIRLTGNPVRQDILNLDGKRERGLEHFGLKEGVQTLLVIGGSLGARTLNLSLSAALDRLRRENIQVIWQTGKHYNEQAEQDIKVAGASKVQAHAFIKRMDLAYAVADLVLSRAGASSISELSIVGKPAILVPYPHAAEDHQAKNAQALVNHHAAILIPDDEAQVKCMNEALELIRSPKRLLQLEKNIKELAFRNADEAIASEVIRIAK